VVREADYVAAARVGGLGDLRILVSHALPNPISQAVVYIMTDIVLVIVAVLTLGYLGLGAQPPTPYTKTLLDAVADSPEPSPAAGDGGDR
jgi:peptide/nickel transport system permease protein